MVRGPEPEATAAGRSGRRAHALLRGGSIFVVSPPPRDPAARRAAAAADLAAAGGGDAPIEIVDADPVWARRFAAERARLAPLLGGAEIEHIGSTAVPGLAAKPIVDVMALVLDVDAPVAALVQEGGYVFPEAYNAQLTGRRWLCRPSAEHREYHLHLVSDGAELERHVRFRDRLRADPELAAEYARMKRDLAARLAGDREAYTAAKSDFVARVEALPPR